MFDWKEVNIAFIRGDYDDDDDGVVSVNAVVNIPRSNAILEYSRSARAPFSALSSLESAEQTRYACAFIPAIEYHRAKTRELYCLN